MLLTLPFRREVLVAMVWRDLIVFVSLALYAEAALAVAFLSRGIGAGAGGPRGMSAETLLISLPIVACWKDSCTLHFRIEYYRVLFLKTGMAPEG